MLTPIEEAPNYPDTEVTSYQNDNFLGSGMAILELTLGRDEATRPAAIFSGNNSMPNKTFSEQISEGTRPK